MTSLVLIEILRNSNNINELRLLDNNIMTDYNCPDELIDIYNKMIYVNEYIKNCSLEEKKKNR